MTFYLSKYFKCQFTTKGTQFQNGHTSLAIEHDESGLVQKQQLMRYCAFRHKKSVQSFAQTYKNISSIAFPTQNLFPPEQRSTHFLFATISVPTLLKKQIKEVLIQSSRASKRTDLSHSTDATSILTTSILVDGNRPRNRWRNSPQGHLLGLIFNQLLNWRTT